MIGMFVVAIVLTAADAEPVMISPARIQPVAAVRPAQPTQLPDTSTWDPDKPSAAWLSKMVRPCARSGNRLVC